MKKSTLVFLLLCLVATVHAQPIYTKADTLRGSLNDQRDWFDILKYDITVQPFYEIKSIKGNVVWTAKVVKASKDIQIDLQVPLRIDSIIYTSPNQKTIALNFTKEGNITVAHLSEHPTLQTNFKLNIYYHGIPIEAIKELALLLGIHSKTFNRTNQTMALV